MAAATAQTLLAQVDSATGHMVLARDGGAIVEASGSLEGQEEKARAVYEMLQNTNCLIQASTGALLRSVTVAFASQTFVVALDDSSVYVVEAPGADGDGDAEGGSDE